jgi:hypothetical protein
MSDSRSVSLSWVVLDVLLVGLKLIALVGFSVSQCLKDGLVTRFFPLYSLLLFLRFEGLVAGILEVWCWVVRWLCCNGSLLFLYVLDFLFFIGFVFSSELIGLYADNVVT